MATPSDDTERIPKGQIADLLAVVQRLRLPFAELIGLRFLSATSDRVTAELLVREDLCTRPAVLHGGALMAFADTLGACATVLNLPEGASTTTIESKTNFFAPAPAGTKVTGECLPLHRGKRTMVWQTRVTSETGRLIAMITQTQMVL
jgi:1,4-dihydroxy-2-naphthoyl-CoA hydrolase